MGRICDLLGCFKESGNLNFKEGIENLTLIGYIEAGMSRKKRVRNGRLDEKINSKELFKGIKRRKI